MGGFSGCPQDGGPSPVYLDERETLFLEGVLNGHEFCHETCHTLGQLFIVVGFQVVQVVPCPFGQLLLFPVGYDAADGDVGEF